MGVGEAFTVAIGIMFILWSTFYDAFKTKGFLKFIKGLFTFGMIVLVIYSGIICVVGKSDNATYREDYIIVLGAGLKGDTPSLALERRLEKAAEYMNKNGNAIAIVSGGQGKGETISEAQAMENYLLNHGIREDRIIKEDNSTSTYENFEYSSRICHKRISRFAFGIDGKNKRHRRNTYRCVYTDNAFACILRA